METVSHEMNIGDQLTFEPLSRNNWDQFVELFGSRGACGNCWCMTFRLKNADFQKGKINDGNKKNMKKLVWNEEPTGLLAFHKGHAIAWCAFAPREVYIKIENSRVHKRIDDQPVWSIPCFFIDKKYRKKGLSVEIVKGVINYAKQKKIKVIEAYPTIPTKGKLPDAFVWTGLFKTFERAGFQIADRKSPNHPMVRYYTK
jgi:GNAT superfamily N-acetyltransferase